jgi:predicted nucleic acid-binding Zn ribbon protein
MPIYVYKHPEMEEYTEVFQGMNDEHTHFDAEGLEWKRVFLVPGMTLDTQVDPYSASDFMKTTGSKEGTIKDLQKLSKELSDQRAQKDGVDPIKQKFFDDHKKKTGRKHKSEARVYESENVKVEYF